MLLLYDMSDGCQDRLTGVDTRREGGGSTGGAKLTLTVEEAAKLLGISRGLAYGMVRVGKIPSVRFGRRILVPRRTLERLLDRCGEKDSIQPRD